MTEHENANQKATPARLARARKQGQIGVSHEIVSATICLGALAILATVGPGLWKSMQSYAFVCWSDIQVTSDATEVAKVGLAASSKVFHNGLLAFLAVVALTAMVASIVQTEFRLFPSQIKPDTARISPSGYLKRVFSFENLTHVTIGIAKLLLLAVVASCVLLADLRELLNFSRLNLGDAFEESANRLLVVGISVAMSAVGIGLVDYGVRFWLNRRRLRMTEQEVREEQRITEPAREIEAHHRLQHRYQEQSRPNLE